MKKKIPCIVQWKPMASSRINFVEVYLFFNDESHLPNSKESSRKYWLTVKDYMPSIPDWIHKVDINLLRGLEDSSLFAEFDRWFAGDMTVDRRVQHLWSFFQIILGLASMGWLDDERETTAVSKCLSVLESVMEQRDYAVNSLVFDDRLNCYLCGRQHTMSKSMTDVDMLLIPVNLDGAHWVLAQVDFRKKKV
ncbi:hypothetical protein CUMW_147220 [Citrus unshiu]|nr:hypothetical protein CUMW_147220 [Citrus unshiu]